MNDMNNTPRWHIPIKGNVVWYNKDKDSFHGNEILSVDTLCYLK